MSTVKLTAVQSKFLPPHSSDSIKKKKDLIALMRHKWPRWEALAAIESIYGPYSYHTALDALKKANADENEGVPKPSLPTWVLSQNNYEEKANELANAHAEQCRQYAATAKIRKAKASKKAKNNHEQVMNSLFPSAHDQKEKSIAIAEELQKEEEKERAKSLLTDKVIDKEKDYLLAIAELYLENRALRQSS